MKKIFYFLLLSSIFYLLSSTPVFAAQIFFESPQIYFKYNQKIKIDVMLDPENQNVNAIEGKIAFPGDLLQYINFEDGNSIINLWVDRPQYTTEGVIKFSGIIPGGFSGVLSPYYEGARPGKILSLIFITKETGVGSLSMRDMNVLLHDGLGTSARTTSPRFNFFINKQDKNLPIEEQVLASENIEEDNIMPEPFYIQISRDPNIFNNKYFLSFFTQDKGSGIGYYEICEGKDCVIAESPYLLQSQGLDKKIIVKAIDRSGNERIAVLPAQNPKSFYKNFLIFAIIIVLGAVSLYMLRKRLWKRLHKK